MFILITPLHNEADQLDELARCVLRSTFKPDIWLIVDDCSEDGTKEILYGMQKQFGFLKVLRIDEKAEYMGYHISEVLRFAQRELQDFIDKAHYIGFLDADIRFNPTYWEKLKNYLDENENAGIVSGVLCSDAGNSVIKVEPFQRIDNPRGGLRLLKGTCFRMIGGVDRTRAWDPVMNVKARTKGWEVSVLPDVYALSTRPTDNRFGRNKGENSRGRRDWHLHQPLWIILVRAMAKSIKGDVSNGYYYLAGYISEWWNKGKQFPDAAVRHYYRVERSREWFRNIKCRIKGERSPHAFIPVIKIEAGKFFSD